MKVHLVQGEHFSVPGIITKVFPTPDAANASAADLVNLMLSDTGWKRHAKPDAWEGPLHLLQNHHGAAHCYVEVSELDVPSPLHDAAPALLAALIGLVGNGFSDEELARRWSWRVDAIRAARAAVALAEGRSNG